MSDQGIRPSWHAFSLGEFLNRLAKPTRGRKTFPYVALAILLFVSLLAWGHFHDMAESRAQRHFGELNEITVRFIRERLLKIEMILQGAAGLFLSSDEVAGDEWRQYVLYRKKLPTFPSGVRNLAVARLIHSADLAAQPLGFTIHPPGYRERFCPLLYVEPAEVAVASLVGFDLLTEPVRRETLERAATTGAAVISGKLLLFQSAGLPEKPGFLMVQPLYSTKEPGQTVEEHRATLWGYVIAAISCEDFFGEVSSLLHNQVELEIYDSRELTPNTSMFNDHDSSGAHPQPSFTDHKVLEFYGRSWSIFFHTTPAFDARKEKDFSRLALAGGLVISLLIFLFLKLLEGTSQRALDFAGEMTLALRESEESYRNLTDNLPVGVAAIAPDLRVILSNRQLREWFPTVDFNLRPACYSVFCLPARSEPCDDCPVIKSLQNGLIHIMEQSVEMPQGIRHFRETAMPMTGPDGKVRLVHIMLEDMTDRKQAERERVARQAAEEANRQKSLFLSNMSHEIRTPMNAILGFAQILEHDHSLSPKQREQVGSINRSGRHLLGLINDILDMSKIEAGMNVLKPQAFCLRDLLEDLEMMFRSRAAGKNLQFLVECEADVPFYILADEGKVRQVLINLLGNAIKFTEAGGVAMRVRASPDPASAGGKANSLRLTVEVEDSGPGIPDVDLQTIFTPFGQGEAGIRAGGTGLGLPISRRLAELMGGGVTVETKVGRGSCFRFDMRCEPTAAVVKEKRLPPRLVIGLEPGTGPFRILVVDDQKTNRDLLCDLLHPLGFEIQQTENGEQALTAFQQWLPHAVLMDMRMPVMDGYEATRRIKALPQGQNIPVIAVTASAFKDSEDQILATGVSAHLRKPFRPEELWAALGDCLGLRYVYADDAAVAAAKPAPSTSSAVDPARVAALPAVLLQAMRRSVAEGDMAQLVELIDQAEPLDAEVARSLRVLADRYDYVRLGVLLGQGGKDNA